MIQLGSEYSVELERYPSRTKSTKAPCHGRSRRTAEGRSARCCRPGDGVARFRISNGREKHAEAHPEKGGKAQILLERDRRLKEGLSVRQNDLMQWAKETFGLPVPPSQSAMSRILCTKDRGSLLSMPKVRRNRGGKLPQLEETLAKWVKMQQAAKTPVKGEMIKARGKSALDELNASLPPSEQLSMQFSTGWLCNFQRRWNIRLSAKEQNQDQEPASLEDIEQLEDAIDRVGDVEPDPNSYVGAPVVERAAEQIPDAPPKKTEEKIVTSSPKRERIPFWFIGLEKLTEAQFATRLVNYICKRVEVANKLGLRDAVRTAAKDNGIDGSTAVLSGNDEDEIAEVLLDDYDTSAEEKEVIVAAGKQFFVELDTIGGDVGNLSQPPRKRQKQIGGR